MSLGTDVLSRTVRTEKLFNLGPSNCFYVNIEGSSKNQENQQEPIIRILNTVCKQTGPILSKVTEIRFREKLIVIEDQYMFGWQSVPHNTVGRASSQPTNCSDGSSQSNNLQGSGSSQLKRPHKKKLIFKKKIHEDHLVQKRNTKNIAKNFCKAFTNYLEEKHHLFELDRARKIMDQHNYNNHTIEALGKDIRLRELFISFLKQKACDWVQSSKIHDKQIHKEAVRLYLELLLNKNKQAQNCQKYDQGGRGGRMEDIQGGGARNKEDDIFQENNSSK